MIFACPIGDCSDSAESKFRANENVTIAICQAVAADEPPKAESFEIFLDPVSVANSEMQFGQITLADEYDWASPKVNKLFIQLEQKTLARKATIEEKEQYYSMRSHRDGAIFSDRYLSDYAEIQRLKILSEKIAEIQKYLRPLKIG